MQDQKPTPENPLELEQQPAAPESAAPLEVAAADVMPSLAESLRQAELKAAEHHDAWLRAKAETENVRRRAQECGTARRTSAFAQCPNHTVDAGFQPRKRILRVTFHHHQLRPGRLDHLGHSRFRLPMVQHQHHILRFQVVP